MHGLRESNAMVRDTATCLLGMAIVCSRYRRRKVVTLYHFADAQKTCWSEKFYLFAVVAHTDSQTPAHIIIKNILLLVWCFMSSARRE